MPPRAKKTIDPASVQTMDQWVDAYTAGYVNIVLGNNGEMEVFQGAGAEKRFVKIIPHAKGLDCTVVLAKELRAPIYEEALTRQSKIDKSIRIDTVSAQAKYLETERSLLNLVEEWKQERDVAIRRGLSVRIGECTKQLQDAELALNKAKYPFRYPIGEVAPKLLIDYATHDERQMVMFRTVLEKTWPSRRTFTVADTV